MRVSIHAFRGEGDSSASARARSISVSIHAFRGEGDHPPTLTFVRTGSFQSTPSGGKATLRQCSRSLGALCFNPRLPGGRRPARSRRRRRAATSFNPRLPGGRRRRRWGKSHLLARFNPRLPGGRRLAPTYKLMLPVWVSIHAFRGEGDVTLMMHYPKRDVFQSTPSGGKATLRATGSSLLTGVSIHAFRGEGDLDCLYFIVVCPSSFNPRLPGGRRPIIVFLDDYLLCFNPRLPGGRRLFVIYLT